MQEASWELGLLSYHLEFCHMQGCLWQLLKQGSGGLLLFRYLFYLLKGTVSLKSPSARDLEQQNRRMNTVKGIYWVDLSSMVWGAQQWFFILQD